ncbi:MAG: acyltransferase [Novosphingobium sp.]
MASPLSDAAAEPDTASRMAWIDVCKGAMILLVILLHATSWFKAQGGDVPAIATGATGFFAPIRMPTLIFLSGLLANRGLRKGPARFLLHRLRILIWPFLVWTAIWALATGKTKALLLPETYLGGWYLWFLLFIALFSMVIALIPSRFHLAAAVYSYVGSLICEDGTKYGERLLFFLAIFLLGAVLGRDRGRLPTWLSDRAAMLALIPAVIAICAFSALERTIRYSPHDALPILVTLAGTLFAAMHVVKVHPLPLLQAIGRESLTVYLTHMPIIATVLRVLPEFGITTFLPTFVISLSAALSGSLAFVYARRRWAIVDALYVLPCQRR